MRLPQGNPKQEREGVGTAFRGAVIRLASGTAIGQVMAFLLTPLLSRRYTPEMFGAFAAQFALATVIATLATGRYEEAVPLPESDREGALLSRVAKGLALAVCLVFSTALLVVPSGWLAELAVTDRLEVAATVFTTSYLLAWLATNKMWALRRNAYRLVSIGTVAQGFGAVALQCLASLALPGYRGLVWGQIAAFALSIVILEWLPYKDRVRRHGNMSFRELWDTAGRHRDFLKYSALGALFDRIGSSVLPWFILSGYGPVAAGLFSFSNRLVLAPVQLVSSSISFAYYSQCGGRSDTIGYARSLYDRLIRRLGAGAVVFLVLGVALSFLAGPLFGAEWADAQWPMAWLMLGASAQLAVAPLGGSVTLCGRQDVFCVREFIRAVLIVAAVPISLGLSLGLQGFWVLLAILTLASYGVYYGASRYAFRYPRSKPVDAPAIVSGSTDAF